MSCGVRIDRLTIEGFRGLSDPIELDLGSPITLIYAPNGTGKTTLCDAAEWLLTGQVERLKNPSFDLSVLRSKFSDREPSVRAEIRIDGVTGSLRRSCNNTSLKLGRQRVLKKASDILAALAPDAAAPDAHHKTAIPHRQQWLRGTRFLSIDALAVLVDTDEASIERRKQVFADLLGIRHLLDAETKLRRYADSMAPYERRRAHEVKRLAEEIKQLQSGLAAEPAGELSVSAIEEQLLLAERSLGLEVDPSQEKPAQDWEDRLEAALVHYGRRERERDRRQGALNQINANSLDVEQLSSEDTKLDWQIAVLDEVEDLFSNRLSAAEARARVYGNQAEALSSRTARAHETSLELRRAASALKASVESNQSRLPIGPQIGWGQLAIDLREADWSIEQLRTRLDRLRQVEREAESIEADFARLRALGEALERAREVVLDDAAIEGLVKSKESAAEGVQEARERVEALSLPLQRLQSAGLHLLEHAHGDDSQCPLCGHEWENLEALTAAVRQALAQAPPLLREAQSALTEAETIAKRSAEMLARAEAKRRELKRIQSEVNQAERDADHHRQLLAEAGLGRADGDAMRLAGPAIARTAVAISIETFLGALEVAQAELNADLGPRPGTLISALEEEVEHVTARLLNEHREIADETARKADDARQELEKLRAASQRESEHRSRLQTRQRQVRAAIQWFRSLWLIAGERRDWSPSNLRLVQNDLEDIGSRLREADVALAGARNASARKLGFDRLQKLQNDLSALRKTHNRAKARLSAARRAANLFQETYADVSDAQIRLLGDVVNPLFGRMHANRIVDAISMGQQADFLHWSAASGEAELDPMTNFSQGQRQDFALALFLARARSFGGTFFLDEPVSHLDDLNKVGLLDVLRVAVLEKTNALSMVVTTASRSLARHLVEKFSHVGLVDGVYGQVPPLRVVELTGNARTGVTRQIVYPS